MCMSSLLAEHVAHRYASTWKQTTLGAMARERYNLVAILLDRRPA
jgi:hypothetical protein